MCLYESIYTYHTNYSIYKSFIYIYICICIKLLYITIHN